jgi:hypothetical protein
MIVSGGGGSRRLGNIQNDILDFNTALTNPRIILSSIPHRALLLNQGQVAALHIMPFAGKTVAIIGKPYGPWELALMLEKN